jgi:hypothetical protein
MKNRIFTLFLFAAVLFVAGMQSAVPLRVCEADGSPCRLPVGTLTVPNGTLSVAGTRATVLQGPRYALDSTSTATTQTLTGGNGETAVLATLSENVTLSTSGATTDSTIDLPANSIILSVVARVTTTIAGANSTTIQIGDVAGPSLTRFNSATSALTAGTTIVGLNQMAGNVSTAATGPTQTATTKVRITLAGGADNTPSAGAVRISIVYIQLTAPTS